jgi:hypothetical protein
MKVAIIISGLLSLVIMSNVGAQVIYKWVDGNDVTHFSEQPPAGVDAERMYIKVQQGNRQARQARTDTSPAQQAAVATRKQQEKEQAAEGKAAAKQDTEMRADTCEKARKRLEKYTTSRRLYRQLEDGEREYLNNEELDNERAEAQRLVDEWCG